MIIEDAKGAKKAPAKVSTKATAPAKASSSSSKAPASKKSSNTSSKKKKTATKAVTTPEAAITQDTLIQWYDVSFYANASKVVGFNNLAISGSVETEDKESDGTKYVSKKNSKGYEISLTAFLDRRLGIEDVRAEAMKLVDYGANGQTGYMYAQGKKLVSCGMMLTNAKAQNVVMTPSGTWISCEVQLTLKTCSKLGNATDNTGNKYKYSVRVYYSGSSGAVQSVVGYSNTSKDDARKKAWAKVPKTALWASETPKQATNQAPKMTDAALEAARKRVATAKKQAETAKTESSKIGIDNRGNAVQNKVKTINSNKIR